MAPKKSTKKSLKATKTKSVKPISKKKATPEPVVEPTPEATTEATPEATPRGFTQVMDECLKLAQDQITSNRTMVKTVREAQKVHNREMREANKNNRRSRRQNNSGVKKPLTGFAKPCRITEQLADFLHDVAGYSDVTRETEMSRTEATKYLNEYFKKNGLRDENDKRVILYKKDPHLVKLLGGSVPSGKNLTYFNLQAAIKDKFIK